jgi:hypothetical protein
LSFTYKKYLKNLQNKPPLAKNIRSLLLFFKPCNSPMGYASNRSHLAVEHEGQISGNAAIVHRGRYTLAPHATVTRLIPLAIGRIFF